MLQITLSDGAHGVRLADTQAEIYIDNYSGFGITIDQYREQPTLTFLADGSCDPVEDEQPGEEPGQDPSGENPDDSQGGTTGDGQQNGDDAQNPQDGQSGNGMQSSQSDKKNDTAPKTGDDFSAAPAVMMIFCAAALAVLLRKRHLQDKIK